MSGVAASVKGGNGEPMGGGASDPLCGVGSQSSPPSPVSMPPSFQEVCPRTLVVLAKREHVSVVARGRHIGDSAKEFDLGACVVVRHDDPPVRVWNHALAHGVIEGDVSLVGSGVAGEGDPERRQSVPLGDVGDLPHTVLALDSNHYVEECGVKCGTTFALGPVDQRRAAFVVDLVDHDGGDIDDAAEEVVDA